MNISFYLYRKDNDDFFFWHTSTLYIPNWKKKSNLVENKCWLTHSCLMYTYPNVHSCILLHVLVTRGTFYYLCDWYFWQAVFRMYKVQQWRLWSRDQRSWCPSQTPRENQGAYKMVTWHEVQIWIWEGT